MASLGDQFVHLSNEIEEREKSVELLTQLIHDQSSRHASEISNFEKEQNDMLAQITNEINSMRYNIMTATKPLTDKKSSLEATINELSTKKREIELTKISNIEATKGAISEAKEVAHKKFMQEKSQRDKCRLDERVAEINRLTWKGIEPNIERLIRKQKDQIEELKSKCEYSKKKLELQFENDLADRIQTYQRNEQQSSNWINQRNEYAVLLAREQEEHALNVKKLKEKLLQEEESMKKLHAFKLEILVKDHSVALSKVESSSSVKELTQRLIVTKRARQRELEATLERAQHDILSIKKVWEESWNKSSAARVEKKHSNTMAELLAWRSVEIDALIRSSVEHELRGGA